MFKKTKKTLAILCLVLMLMATVCFATDGEPVVTSENPDATTTSDTEPTEDTEHNHDHDEVAEDDFHEDDLYLAGDTVSCEKTIDGNAFLMGKEITVSSKIGGDLFILGETVTLTEDSYIYGNLFIYAKNVTINGIACDLYTACDSLTLGESGIVLRDMRTISASLALNGSVGRNTYVEANTLTMGENAHVYGNFNYTASEAIQVPSGAVDGNINYSELSVSSKTEDGVFSYVMDCVFALVYTLVVFGIMILLAPNFLKKLKDVVGTKSLPSFGIGLLALILPIPVVFLLILSVVGVPVAFALLLVWGFITFGLAFSITAIAIANFVGSKVPVLGKAHNVLAVILVTLVLWGLTQIPFYVGSLVQFVVYVLGLGYLFVTAFKNRKKEE